MPATPPPEPVKAIVAATPPPTSVIPVETPATPAPNHFAPEGVYFLIAAASVETSDGIAGLRPGTRAVKQADGRYLADGHLVELRPEQLTNDLRVARQISRADTAAEIAVREAYRGPATPPPASAAKPRVSQPQPAVGQAVLPEATPAKFVAGTNTLPGGLQSSSTLGAGHTRTANGFLWEKSPDGEWWVPVRSLKSKSSGYLPPRVKIQ